MTQTNTPTPCPTHQLPNPEGGCATITPTYTPTPCPTHQFPVDGACATITPTPTSQRPYGAEVRVIEHYPSPPVSTQKKTWVFEIENIASSRGCKPHEVTLNAQLTGVSDAAYTSSASLGCHVTTQVTISSIVTVPPNAKVGVSAHASAGAAQGDTIDISETVVNPPPPTPKPPLQLGDFNCDGAVNAIDAALVLQVEAGMAVPLPCTGDADVNHDGLLDALDALLILQYVVGLLPAFP